MLVQCSCIRIGNRQLQHLTKRMKKEKKYRKTFSVRSSYSLGHRITKESEGKGELARGGRGMATKKENLEDSTRGGKLKGG